MSEGKMIPEEKNTKKVKEKTYTVNLPKKHGEEAKFVGIDGIAYLVKRGVAVEVNEKVYNELQRVELAEAEAEERAEALAAKE